ncbi:MAG: PH domain-containing protein [Nanoarchaeota archaeon]|nr:PH domain-containing protein [Nanoarchaeota archaeon]
MKTQLHPGARWLFRLKGYFGAIFLMFFVGWFIFPGLFVLLGIKSIISLSSAIAVLLVYGLLIIFLVIIIAEIYARMAYNRWFYEFTDSNLKLERGIIWKRYSNVPYERVQNVDIHRGILARILGFSSVMIQTAGYSGTGRGAPTEGYLPAVDIEHAEEIRDFLMKKISKKSSGGL